MKSHMLACFFYGLITTLMLGGYLCDKYGGRKLILFGFGVQIICSTTTPIILLNEPYLFFPARIIQGMGVVSILE